MVNEYISLNLGPVDGIHKKSLWRTWNQLSRLQRNIIYLLLFVLFFSLIYLMHMKKNEKSLIKPNALKSIIKTVTTEQIEKSVMPVFSSTTEVKKNDVMKELNFLKENAIEEVKALTFPKKFKGPRNERQEAVVSAFRHAWKGYRAHAWGHDMLKPISKSYHDWFSLGLTVVDALDTMIIMNLEDIYVEARQWVNESLNFSIMKDVNLFEVTIRVLGGLLSAYHLTNDAMFLHKATDLGTRLLPCFDTDSGVPYSDINLATLQAHSPKWSPDSSTSEVTTIQLEFRDLSRCTGNPKFEESAAKVSAHVHRLDKTEGLVPIFINANTGDFRSYATITLGARGDSYYEYLLKQWIQTGRTINYLRDDYLEAMNGVQKLLVRRTSKNKLLFVGELLSGGKDFKPKMDHLTCYLPGTLALGVMYGMPNEHMDLAEELLYTCYQTYAWNPTFLAPEISYFNIQDSSQSDIYVKSNDAHNLLRPEFVESLWVMYQITGNTTYQEWGWQVFQSFEKYAKVTHGYTSIGNVKSVRNTRPKDMMESFFLGETLKVENPVKMGQWHELRLSRTGRFAILQVDDQPPVHALAPGAFTQLSLPQNLYIGGVPNFEMVSPKVKVRNSFVGCIQKVVINDKPLQILAEALAGVNVANCPHPCVAQPCGAGKCIPILEYFTCECTEGYKNRECQQHEVPAMLDNIAIPRFTGSSYLHYSNANIMKRIVSNQMKFSIRFKTNVPNGLILWTGDQGTEHRSDFLSLGLQDGELHFRFNLGGGEVDITYNESSLADGEWHEVTGSRAGKRGHLSVDGRKPVVRTVPGKLTQLNTNTGLYVGGVENIEEDTLQKYTSGLVGCISTLVLDTDYDVKLMAMSTAGRNVQHCN